MDGGSSSATLGGAGAAPSSPSCSSWPSPSPLGPIPRPEKLTGRFERLQRRVDALGAFDDLAARIELEGREEVAELAESFNLAAARIEKLVEAQKTLFAGASHELRTPLARIRVALELLDEHARPELRERIARNVENLEERIGELLLASAWSPPTRWRSASRSTCPLWRRRKPR